MISQSTSTERRFTSSNVIWSEFIGKSYSTRAPEGEAA